MKIVIQRVNEAQVLIDNKIHSTINKGLLIFLGIHIDDAPKDVIYLVKKIMCLRIFENQDQKMNLSIMNLKLSIMLVSQFTLYANIKKGNRPSFVNAAKAKHAKSLYNLFIEELKKYNINLKTGEFGKKMKVKLINDGPNTFILES